MNVGQVAGDNERLVRTAVTTRERSEASALLHRTFPGLHLQVESERTPFLFRHTSVDDGRLLMAEYMVSGSAVESGAIARDGLAVGLLLAGSVSGEIARHPIDGTRPFLRPPIDAVIRLHDAHVRLVRFDPTQLESARNRWEEANGCSARFVRLHPSSEAADHAWRWAAAHIQATLASPRAAANPIISAELFDLAVRVLIASFADTESSRTTSATGGSSRALRRAIDYLEAHVGAPVTIPEVAMAARLSVRSLQSLFQRDLGVSPLEFLHGLRLDSARRDLLSAYSAGEDVSIRVIAERWGFANSGRFARIYAARFGQRPSDTLRHGVRRPSRDRPLDQHSVRTNSEPVHIGPPFMPRSLLETGNAPPSA